MSYLLTPAFKAGLARNLKGIPAKLAAMHYDLPEAMNHLRAHVADYRVLNVRRSTVDLLLELVPQHSVVFPELAGVIGLDRVINSRVMDAHPPFDAMLIRFPAEKSREILSYHLTEDGRHILMMLSEVGIGQAMSMGIAKARDMVMCSGVVVLDRQAGTPPEVGVSHLTKAEDRDYTTRLLTHRFCLVMTLFSILEDDPGLLVNEVGFNVMRGAKRIAIPAGSVLTVDLARSRRSSPSAGAVDALAAPRKSPAPHDVRGHWARFSCDPECEHDWHDDPNPNRRWQRCSVCGGGRTWRNAFHKGDGPSVEKAYRA